MGSRAGGTVSRYASSRCAGGRVGEVGSRRHVHHFPDPVAETPTRHPMSTARSVVSGCPVA